MAQKIIAIPDKDVIVAVPAKYRGHELFVKDKRPQIMRPSVSFERFVINFLVYYKEGGNKIAVTKFNPFMQIWIGYRKAEEYHSLFYWDADLLQKVPMAHSKDNFKHSNDNFKNADKKGIVFEGFGYAETKKWDADPNLGWG